VSAAGEEMHPASFENYCHCDDCILARMSRGIFAFCAQLGEIYIFVSEIHVWQQTRQCCLWETKKVSKIKWWRGIFIVVFQVHVRVLL